MTLKLKNISKVVGGETHIDGIDLTLTPGSFNVLLGRTLSGKTTTLRILAGLEQPSSGSIVEDGRDVTGLTVRNRSVAMVYQQFINYPAMTVYQNIASPLKLARVPKAEIDRRVRETAEMLHMEAMLHRLPGELSGGQQQRTAMARALVRECRLLLLDEPLVNLDYKLREELRSELREILKTRDSVVVYATTEPHEALILGGDLAVLHEGRLLQYGETSQVFRNPSTIDGAKVFSDPPMNLAPARVVDGQMRIGEHASFPLPPHLSDLAPGDYIVGLRPHLLSITDSPVETASMRVQGTCELTEISGSASFVHINDGNVSWVGQISGVHGYGMGESVTFYASPGDLFAFSAAGKLVRAPGTSMGTSTSTSTSTSNGAQRNGTQEVATWHA